MKKRTLVAPLFLFCFLALAPDAHAATTTMATTSAVSQAASEQRIREFFAGNPVMIEIARCESNFRQFTDAGNVLRGGDGGGMVGVFQFFESIHDAPAKSLGYDITTLEDNLGYAQHLYDTQGTAPWEPARSCWDVHPTTTKTSATRAELEAKIKQLLEIIKLLQQLQELRSKQIT